MCGIVGVCNHVEASQKVLKALSLLENRGKDGVGIATTEIIQHAQNLDEITPVRTSTVFGHRLHSIVGHVAQPIKDEMSGSILSANCEIYNWQELNNRYKAGARNDADFLLWFLNSFGTDRLEVLDGVYAFSFCKENRLILARDLMGIKPLFFSHTTDSFAYASEKKVLEAIGSVDIQELNPRQILHYNINTHTISIKKRDFLTHTPEHTQCKEEIKKTLKELLENSITKRLPSNKNKVGLLFSGGIDSTFIAHTLKKKEVDFTCYTTVLDSDTVVPQDLIYAQKVAEDLGLTLKIKRIPLQKIEEYLKIVVPLIEDTNVVKVGVALTFYAAAQMAKEDGCKVLFSGLGSEEIFAGYDRHKKSGNINLECVSGLRKMYERDLYRDDVISMNNSVEMRIPFLDIPLITYALRIPENYKIIDGMGKYILREIALDLGIKKEFAMRPKKAAQYGSRIDNAIGRMAKKSGYKFKSEYLKGFYPSHNLRLGVLFSSGKDSNYAAHIMKKQNYDVSCLITIQSENPDSYMFQSAGLEIIELSANALGIPLVTHTTKGYKEKELKDLHDAIVKAKYEHKIDGIITGAMFSEYQRERIEKICDSLGLKIFSPLWHKDQAQEMRELIALGFKFILIKIAADGLNSSWLGRTITLKDVEKLVDLNSKIGFNCAGEGGEFESLVLDGPIHTKKIVLDSITTIQESEYCAHLKILSAHLEEK
jgi:diphthine-ammonia ligase